MAKIGIQIIEGDLHINGKSLMIGNTDAQICELLLSAAPGEFKAHPILGLNLIEQLGGTTDPFFAGKVREQIKASGVQPKKMVISNTQIDIEL